MTKTIGIVGGLSPESTVYYYQYITHQYYEQFGNYNYPKIIIFSVTFQQYIDWMTEKNYSACEDDLVDAVSALNSAGADFAIIATNTLHYFYDPVSSRVNIPIINLVDTVRDYAQKHNLKKLILLGTKFTMTKPFYSEALAKAGIETLMPEPEAQNFIHKSIFEELTRGIIKSDTKKKYIKIIEELTASGADGVILGCTEIPLLIKQDDLRIHVVDSSEIHAEAALKYALE